MSAKTRRKRAAPTDLYKSCLAGGDCIPDVKNKFENTTLADTLLKIFGSIVYFGGLGIGSGKGSGGSLGYRPLGAETTPSRVAPANPLRPSVIVDPLLPTDVITVDPSTPSIVPLAEGRPDIDFVAPDGGPGLGAEEIELYTIKTPTTDIGGVGGEPTVISSEEGATAILPVDPVPEGPTQIFYDPSAPSQYELNIFTAHPTVSSDVNVFVDNSFSGNVVGQFEEIPLERLNYSTFDIEEPPLTSTPSNALERVATKAKSLYNRFTKQVSVRDPDFLIQPSRLVQFEFENPAFERDVTLQFEQDVQQVTAAPNPDFADVIQLGRPILSQTEEGVVRVSRLGKIGTVTTRSGKVIGQPIHYYQDLSIIDPESIELHNFAEHSNQSTIVDDVLSSSTFSNPVFDIGAVFDDDALIDLYDEDFRNTNLVVSITEETNDSISFPILTPSPSIKVFVSDIGNIFVSSQNNQSIVTVLDDNIVPLTPTVVGSSYFDYYIEPYYVPKKKRRRLDMF
uniref:Minor capsid protein L2 n=1 Tax=Human papillomavirus TaxID=10566 RepID=A0A385PKY1_9PAPI|nr:MAG: L2 protein [Human papillomavirus]